MNEQNYSAGSPSESQKLNEPTAVYDTRETLKADEVTWLDEELKHAWQGLSGEQKKLMVDLMKEMLRHKKPANIPQEEWAEMMRQRDGFLAGTAKTYTVEEAREIVTNKDKRHEFLNQYK